jgi:hypothetical protein
MEKQDFSLVQRVQTGFDAHTASYPVGTAGKATRVMKVTTLISFLPRMSGVELHRHTPITLRDV